MSYQEFSYYYDSLMDPRFYEDYHAFIKEHASFQEVLDLGCGTGEMAIRFAKDGKKVLACDLSQDMIEITREKALENHLDIMVERIDMTDFMLSKQIDCVVCLCDSLNYVLSKKKVQNVFDNVYEGLKFNGTFIFDVNSLYKCNVILKDYHEDNHDDDYSFSWGVTSDGKGSIEHHVMIEDKENNEKVDEIHLQKSLSVSEYQKMLKKAGFKNISLYSDFGEYQEECERVIFVCKKER